MKTSLFITGAIFACFLTASTLQAQNNKEFTASFTRPAAPSFNIYTNPTITGDMEIFTDEPLKSISVVDINNQDITSQVYTKKTDHKHAISFYAHHPGVYILKATTKAGESITRKLIFK